MVAFDCVSSRCMREITSRLVRDLDLKIASEFIFDESYWKQRCYQLLPKNYQINEHGLTWKQCGADSRVTVCSGIVRVTENASHF